MHSHSLNAWQLAVPGIGFPQHISVGPDAFDLEAFRSGRITDVMPRGALAPVSILGLHAAVRRSIETILRAPMGK
jgi:hypothetical protein